MTTEEVRQTVQDFSAALLGMWLFDEPRDVSRLACIGLIVIGVVGLRLTTTGAE